MEVVQPALRRHHPAGDPRLDRLRRPLPVLRVPVRRPGARADQDVDHPARQHLQRRLGRSQPRCARHGAGVVPHDGESERHPAGHAEQRRRATRTSSPDWIWESAGRRNERGYTVEIRLPLESIRFKGGDDSAHGDPVLAPRQPHRRVGGVAGARAGQVGVRQARRAACSITWSRASPAR